MYIHIHTHTYTYISQVATSGSEVFGSDSEARVLAIQDLHTIV